MKAIETDTSANCDPSCGKGSRTFIVPALAVAVSVALALPRNVIAADAQEPGLRLATFCCDATPPLGETLVWDVPLTNVLDRLWLKGIVLDDDGKRYILCALDWCLLCNGSERAFRETLARAAGSEPARVAIQCVHQHAAPYADEEAHRLLDDTTQTPHLTTGYLEGFRSRMSAAVSEAVGHLERIDRIGCGTARVDRVASQRRLMGSDGKIITRVSEGARNPAMALLPEGEVDPLLRTVSLAQGDKVLARLHYYATHPQTHSCDGTVSSDFVGKARESLEREEGVFQVYFNGCGANVTVGKYNDGTLQAREALAERLTAGMRAAVSATRYVQVGRLVWRQESPALPVRTDTAFVQELHANLVDTSPALRVYKGAMRLSTVARAGRPFGMSALQIGCVHIVNLPGEPMLAYQLFAQQCCPGDFVAVAGYGDCAPAYVCTDRAFAEGGYEPANSVLAPGAEPVIQGAIKRLLGL